VVGGAIQKAFEGKFCFFNIRMISVHFRWVSPLLKTLPEKSLVFQNASLYSTANLSRPTHPGLGLLHYGL
jgi:hypothetical protein